MNRVSENKFATREFPMTDSNFAKIKNLAYSLTGIKLSDHKKDMIYGRLARRLRKLQLNNFDQYCSMIDVKSVAEHTEFINAITTNLTSFFRENHHFEHLKEEVIPKLAKENKTSRRIRIWSAGCSTGEEPYSIAMVLASLPYLKGWDVKVLATDLDSNVVKTSKSGIYSLHKLDSFPSEYEKYIQRDESSDQAYVKDSVKSFITFKQLNLLHDWPMKGPFDVIFCRNVVIYFDKPTQVKLFDRYANILVPDGMLYIGHSETLHNVSNRFKSLGGTRYLKAS